MSPTPTQTTLAVVACSFAVGLGTGCGGDEDAGRSADDVADAYVVARSQSDAAALCALYTEEIQQQTEPRQSCDAFVRERMAEIAKEQKGLRLSVMRVDAQGNSATAVIATQVNGVNSLPFTLPLERQGEDWAVAGFDLNTGL